MLTDVPNQKSARSKPAKKPGQIGLTNHRYSDGQKMDVVKMYLMCGNLSAVSVATKIPLPTLNYWKSSQWWSDLINEFRKEKTLVLSARMQNIVDKSWGVVEDRLEHGDWIYDQKSGQMRRKPVSLKDAAKVATDAVKLTNDMEKLEQFTVTSEQIGDKLDELAKQFALMVTGKKPSKENAEDVDYVERVDGEPADEEFGAGVGPDGAPEEYDNDRSDTQE